MPEGGIYEKVPRPESIEALIDYTSRNPCVSIAEQVDTQMLSISRPEKGNLKVHMTNIYVLSESDVEEILLFSPDIDCIVTVSAWNSYTSSANELAKQRGIGLFKFKEFLGALYYEGQRFIDYEPPKRNDRF